MFSFKNYILEEFFCDQIIDKIAISIASESIFCYINEAIKQDPFDGPEDAKPVWQSDELNQSSKKSFSNLTKDLRDSIIWIRWHSMLSRQKNSNFLKKLLSQYRKVKNFDWSKATPILKEMGYLDIDKLNDSGISEESREKVLLTALQNASNEKGNELPVDVDEEDISKNIMKARQTFFNALKEIFDKQYSRIAGDVGPNEKRGYRFFSDKDDLANKFMLRMYELISERPRLKNEIVPWKALNSGSSDFGYMGKSEFDSDNLLDELLVTLKGWLSKELSKEKLERRTFNSPSAGLKDDITNRSKKQSIINLDLINAQKTRSNKPLAFYLKYIDAYFKNKTLKPRTSEDEMRMEIMRHIESIRSRYPDLLSFDSNKIIETLSNYRNIFSKKTMQGPTFMGNANPTEKLGDEEEIIKKTDTRSRLASSLASYRQNPEIQSKNSELGAGTRETALSKLHSAMDQLAAYNPKWALAICVKFGLNCSNGRVNSVDNFSNAIIRMTKDGKSWGSTKTDCSSQLSSIGLRMEDVVEQLSSLLGSKQGYGTVYNWVTNGLKFICRKMQS